MRTRCTSSHAVISYLVMLILHPCFCFSHSAVEQRRFSIFVFCFLSLFSFRCFMWICLFSLAGFILSSCSLSTLLIGPFSSPVHPTLRYMWERQLRVGCGCLGVSVCLCVCAHLAVSSRASVCPWYVCDVFLNVVCVRMVCMSASCGVRKVTAPLQTSLTQEVDSCGGVDQKQLTT